jgi:predicted dehydrogenase
VTARDIFVKRPWVGRKDIAEGSHAQGQSQDKDKARFLTGLEFTHIVSQIMPLTIKSDADFPIEGGLHMHLAKLADGVVGNFQFTVSSGEGKWEFILSGDEGTLILNRGDAIRRQRADEDEPVPVEIPLSDQLPAGVDLMQHTWNRLIADFIQAIRQGDVNHTTVPHLPTFEDGLRCQEIIAAARRSEEDMRWVSLAESVNTQ